MATVQLSQLLFFLQIICIEILHFFDEGTLNA